MGARRITEMAKKQMAQLEQKGHNNNKTYKTNKLKRHNDTQKIINTSKYESLERKTYWRKPTTVGKNPKKRSPRTEQTIQQENRQWFM